jgi:predicted acyl esterase
MATQNAVKCVDNAASGRNTEYTIYTFGASSARGTSPTWQKQESLIEKEKALRMARTLYDSGHFQRIEIKSRYFDRRAGRVVDLTLKTFGHARRLQFGLPAVVVFAAVCGMAAFFLAGMIH